VTARLLARLLALLLALAVAVTSAFAQGADSATARARADSVRADSILEARTSELAAQLRCAVCQGISIQESPSALAREMREVVKEQLREGRTPDEVKEYFVAAYGEWILLSPRPHGLNLLLYVLPAALLLGGIAFLAFVVRRWTSPAPPPAA
jgi:cytochrome c-type biogenesis protein CcmH